MVGAGPGGSDADDTRRGPAEGTVRWVSPQSDPTLHPPYHTGAARSPLIAMLQQGHYDVLLPPRDLQMMALWIDLGVPFVGDYTEANAWSESDIRRYEHFVEKRVRMATVERDNIQALIDDRME